MAKRTTKSRPKASKAKKAKPRAGMRKRTAAKSASARSASPAAGRGTKSKSRAGAKKTTARKKATTRKKTAATASKKRTSAGKAVRGKSTAAKASKKRTASSKAVRRKVSRSAASTAKRPAKEAPARSSGAGKPARIGGRRLTPADLDVFRELLLEKRAELAGDVNHLQAEAMGRNPSDGNGVSSNMPTHMADAGTDNWEQELTLGFLQKDMSLIRDIDEALERIQDGTYGRCVATDQHIRKQRLRAKPWARYCIEHVRMMEQGLVP